MIQLFTDFGSNDIYLGQVKLSLLNHHPQAQVIDLLHHAPNFDALASAHLLAALNDIAIPDNSVTMAVVDAGVGSTRDPIALKADDRWFVGPDNGLLSVVASRAGYFEARRINWQPDALSHSFHGRDLFAAVAARLDANTLPPDWLGPQQELSVNFGAADLPQVIYIDHYGNAMTGLKAQTVPTSAMLHINGVELSYARVFSEAPYGQPFWYVNSLNLVEIAANCAHAAQLLGLHVGDPTPC